MKRNLASDNNAAVHPAVMRALEQANEGHAVGYGDDDWTRKAEQVFRHTFGKDAETYFVYTGTGANILGLSSVCRSFHAVLAAETSHVFVDECGGFENFAGCQIIPLPSEGGKIDPRDIGSYAPIIGFEHHAQPRVVTITQATEYGTVYTVEEIAAIAEAAHRMGCLLHMDGARIANAAAALNCGFREITTDAGVDILSFGGTKNGLMFGEAIVFLKPGLSEGFRYLRKQSMQLASKMRYIAAQFSALLTDDLWRKNASQANALARRLAAKLDAIDAVEVTQPVESNAVFARLPRRIIAPLQERVFFYPWDPAHDEMRFVTAWDNTEEDLDAFVAEMTALLESPES